MFAIASHHICIADCDITCVGRPTDSDTVKTTVCLPASHNTDNVDGWRRSIAAAAAVNDTVTCSLLC